MMRDSPLRLKELFFPQVSVKAQVPKAPDRAPRELALESLDISFAYDLDPDGNSVSAGIKVATRERSPDAPDEAALYEVQVEAFANFDVIGPEHKDPLAVYLRKVAAAGALIGAVREQVAMTSARGPWGVVMLPMISMDKVVGPPPKKTESPVSAPEQAASATKVRTKRKTPAI